MAIEIARPKLEGNIAVGEDRQIGFAEFGAPWGRAVFWLHVTPGARRQIPIEADELELREDPDQPCRQTWGATVRTVSAKQVLELLAGRPPLQPQAPIEGHERSTQAVLQLMHLLCKA